MTGLSNSVTTQNLLDSLKTYIVTNLKTNQKLVKSVKAGLIDIRDELPFVMVLPRLETIAKVYNAGLFDIERTFRIDIVDTGYHTKDVRNSLKTRLAALKALFEIDTLGWQLRDANGNIQAADYKITNELFGEPSNSENQYTQFCTVEFTLRSYYQSTGIIFPLTVSESSPIVLLDYLYDSARKDMPQFSTYWRDNINVSSLNSYPQLGMFFQGADADKESQTSTDFDNVGIVYRVYSSLATKEVAFINHLANVENVKQWILNRPMLDGSVQNFQLFSVDYGIDNIARPYQGQMQRTPVFRSDITTQASLLKFN